MNVYCMMLSFFLVFCVFGQAFARSLLQPADPDASFGASMNGRQLMDEAYFDNQEQQLLDVRLQKESSLGQLDLLNNMEQLFVVVKTKTTRGKRYIQQHLTPCFFKICNMGRKRLAQSL